MNKRKLIKFIRENPNEIKEIIENCPSYENSSKEPNDSNHEFEEHWPTGIIRWRPAIICASILVLVVTILLTPPGRALAKEFYTTVVNWICSEEGTSLEIQHAPEVPPEIDNSAPEIVSYEYNSLEELPNEFKIVYLDNDRFALSNIYTEITLGGYDCRYKFIKDNMEYNVHLSCFNCEAAFAVSFADGKPITVKTVDGLEVNGIWNKESCTAVTYLDNTEIYFYADNVSYDDFIDFIESTAIIY